MDAPPSPLLSMPSEIVSLMLDHLSISDIRNFRQVSHWAESEAFWKFARRGYGHLVISARPESSLHRLLDVVEQSEPLARAVKEVSVDFHDSGWVSTLELEAHRRRAAKLEHGPLPSLSAETRKPRRVLCLLPALPKVQALRLASLSSVAFSRQFQAPAQLSGELPAQPIALPSTLRTLTISHSELSARDLELLFQNSGSALTELRLIEVTLTTGHWRDVLVTIRSAQTRLVRLELSSLCDVRLHRTFKYVSLAPLFRKAFKGARGIEVVSVQGAMASMMGAEAVRMGLDVAVERVAGYLEGLV
ncbi:hypothetical protein LTR53_007378 [Teratosphaeriaceae sp. CCFEE 6253]|nr:hypothetical protein LTR53_007378 [Teratosphaeriaceae sp. CCFEE 6253]